MLGDVVIWLRSSFRFQYPRHFIGGGGHGVSLEITGHDNDGIAHADFSHAVEAADGSVVILFGLASGNVVIF